MSAGFHYRTSIFLDQLYLWMVCFLKCWVDSSLGNTETAQLCYLLSPSELQCRQPIPDRLWQDTNFCFLEARSHVGQAGLELIWSSYVSKDDIGLFFTWDHFPKNWDYDPPMQLPICSFHGGLCLTELLWSCCLWNCSWLMWHVNLVLGGGRC